MNVLAKSMIAGLGLFAAFVGGYFANQNSDYTEGRWEGYTSTVVYCNISLDYCKLELQRMADMPANLRPAIYKELIQ